MRSSQARAGSGRLALQEVDRFLDGLGIVAGIVAALDRHRLPAQLARIVGGAGAGEIDLGQNRVVEIIGEGGGSEDQKSSPARTETQAMRPELRMHALPLLRRPMIALARVGATIQAGLMSRRPYRKCG
jgi:hypothetical protein